jgi:hypothetical protein
MKTVKNHNLQLITAIYFAFYFIGFIIPFFTVIKHISRYGRKD